MESRLYQVVGSVWQEKQWGSGSGVHYTNINNNSVMGMGHSSDIVEIGEKGGYTMIPALLFRFGWRRDDGDDLRVYK